MPWPPPGFLECVYENALVINFNVPVLLRGVRRVVRFIRPSV